MTENNGLPPGWIWTNLESVAEIILGQSPPSSTYNENGDGLPFYQGKAEFGDIYPTPKKWCNAPKKIAKKDDVLISVRAPVGPTNICPETSCIGRGLAAIRPLHGIPTKFILHLLRAYESVLAGKGTGTTFKAITGNQLKGLEIPLPPLPEQERIVAKIEELFTQLEAGVAELQQAKAQLQRYRQAVLKSAVEGELTREWREARKGDRPGRPYESGGELLARILSERRSKWEAEELDKLRAKGKEPKNDKWKTKYQEPALPDTKDLPNMPEDWVWVSVGQVAEHRLGKMLDKAKNIGKLTPYLRNINVRWFEFDISDLQHMRVTDDEIDNVSVRAGDLVVCEGGEPGRASVWEKEGEPFVIQKALHRVRTADGVLPWFLAYHLVADAWTGRLKEYFTGSTIMHFTGQSLHSYVFALPPTIEQELIIQKVERRLSVADEIEKELNQALARSERLRQSILKRAFVGKLV